MPTYEYQCLKCKNVRDIIKSISHIDEEEFCEDCKSTLIRIISKVQLSPTAKAYEAHHNHAFGKVITSKRQISEEQARYKGEKGRELVEVGSDDLSSVKPVRKKYTVDGLSGLN